MYRKKEQNQVNSLIFLFYNLSATILDMSGSDIDTDLNNIFVEIGEFGPQQVVILLLFTILNISTAATFTIYMISANPLDYR